LACLCSNWIRRPLMSDISRNTCVSMNNLFFFKENRRGKPLLSLILIKGSLQHWRTRIQKR
jgi:hypothetical protein